MLRASFPVDAFPDVTNIQVQIVLRLPADRRIKVERMVTSVRLKSESTGLPVMTEMRSQNEPGLSIVTLVFTDLRRYILRGR